MAAIWSVDELRQILPHWTDAPDRQLSKSGAQKTSNPVVASADVIHLTDTNVSVTDIFLTSVLEPGHAQCFSGHHDFRESLFETPLL